MNRSYKTKSYKTWIAGFLAVSQLAWGIPLPVFAQEPSSQAEGRDLERVSFVPPELQPTDSPIVVPSYVEETVAHWGIVFGTMEVQVAPPAEPTTPLQEGLGVTGLQEPGGDAQIPEEQSTAQTEEDTPEPQEGDRDREPAGTEENPPPQAAASTQNSQAAQDILDWINSTYTTDLARRRVAAGLQPLINLLNNLPSWMQATASTLQNGNLQITLTVTIGGVTITVGTITLHKIFLGVVVNMGPVTITGIPAGTTITIATPGSSQVVITRDSNGEVVSVKVTLADGTEIILYQRPE